MGTNRDKLPEMTLLYTVKSGQVANEHYGLTLAKAVGLPAKMLEQAERVSHSLRQQRDAQRQDSEGRKLIRRRKLVIELYERLRLVSVEMEQEGQAGRL